MTKKTYEKVAQVLYEVRDQRKLLRCLEPHEPTVYEIQEKLADVFKSDNLMFDREKFRTACNTGKHIRKSIREGA
jgi:hypothetical protein